MVGRWLSLHAMVEGRNLAISRLRLILDPRQYRGAGEERKGAGKERRKQGKALARTHLAVHMN